MAQDGPADEAGLQGSDKTLTMAGETFQLGGDLIIAIDDQPVEGIDDLITYLIEETRPDEEVTLMASKSRWRSPLGFGQV